MYKLIISGLITFILILIALLVFKPDNFISGKQFVYLEIDNKSYQINESLIKRLHPNIKIRDNEIFNISILTADICKDKKQCFIPVKTNLYQYFKTAIDHNKELNAWLTKYPFQKWDINNTDFWYQYSQAILKEGFIPSQTVKPYFGINSEAPQAEISEAKTPIMFVDLFRSARPPEENKKKDSWFYHEGWPYLSYGQSAVIYLLERAEIGDVPEGLYHVFYEGTGTIDYDGFGTLVERHVDKGYDIIKMTLGHKLAMLKMTVKDGPLKDIRVVMPGGICSFNQYVRVPDASYCPEGTYHAFHKFIGDNRQAIIFNPDYLRLLKDFKVLRMMNYMEASPSKRDCWSVCFTKEQQKQNIVIDKFLPKDILATHQDADGKDCYGKGVVLSCLINPMEWSHRSTMNDAVWGGSWRTDRLERFGKGLPIEVQVGLSNRLAIDPWFTIPHNATDDYVKQFAAYVNRHLEEGLIPHVEYSNETWNGIFMATEYVRLKGKGMYNGKPNMYRDGLLYYAKRTREVHDLWESQYNRKFKRVVSTYQQNDSLSDLLLGSEYLKGRIDELSTGAYFYGCWGNEPGDKCKGLNHLREVTHVDQIFNIINDPKDRYSLPSLMEQLNRQNAIADKYGVDLVVYEGGQHLTIRWEDGELTREEKMKISDIMHQANRDPRMRSAYLKLFNHWEKLTRGKLFTVFSMPHNYQRFGSFGIKENLNALRNDSPKYDAILLHQESR